MCNGYPIVAQGHEILDFKWPNGRLARATIRARPGHGFVPFDGWVVFPIQCLLDYVHAENWLDKNKYWMDMMQQCFVSGESSWLQAYRLEVIPNLLVNKQLGYGEVPAVNGQNLSTNHGLRKLIYNNSLHACRCLGRASRRVTSCQNSLCCSLVLFDQADQRPDQVPWCCFLRWETSRTLRISDMNRHESWGFGSSSFFSPMVNSSENGDMSHLRASWQSEGFEVLHWRS